MANVTIRNIPDSTLEHIKTLSALERPLSPEMQTDMWMSLSGKWEDERSAEEIVEDIYENRTAGRDVEL